MDYFSRADPGHFSRALKHHGRKPILHPAILRFVRATAARAQIPKRIYSHLFRHTRVTHVLATGLMSESQAKHYFGWTPSSPMLSRYLHLVTKDVDDAYKRMLGLPTQAPPQAPELFRVQICEHCQAANTNTHTTCWRCTKNLAPETPPPPAGARIEDILQDPDVQTLLAQKLRELRPAS
jgi:integrase/recombinase XerD